MDNPGLCGKHWLKCCLCWSCLSFPKATSILCESVVEGLKNY